jgi:Rps23 Pro-64 3,4-dihydroxylase Tpa1-like proline 4-hydroxylase
MDKFIFEFENIIPGDICKEIIQKFDSDDRKKPGEMSRGVDKSVKDSIDIYSYFYEDWHPLCKNIIQYVVHGMHYYIDHLNRNGLNKNNVVSQIMEGTNIYFPQIQKTSEGGFYDWHMDSRDDRMLTYICYLNDVEEGSGGTTDFCNGRSIIPREGKFLIFPSSWSFVHSGIKLKKGFKYIATGYIHRQGIKSF